MGTKTLLQYQHWINERCLHAMGQRGQWVIILDLHGVSTRQCFLMSHLRYCHMLAVCDSAHYPARLGQVFIINAPSVFATPFKLTSSWLDEKTRRKVQCLGDDWRASLSEIMDLHILPRHLG